MHIEFNAKKNETNILERSLSFERASDFDFDRSIIKQDVRKPYPKVRSLRTRLSNSLRAQQQLDVCRQWRGAGTVTRVKPHLALRVEDVAAG